MKTLLLRMFTWWNSQTFSGWLWTYFTGIPAGIDAFGNRYYSDQHGRRWVVYHGVTEASKVPPPWHAWLHKMRETPPTPEESAENWTPNMTGTELATRPSGSLAGSGIRKPATGDYEPWQPPNSDE